MKGWPAGFLFLIDSDNVMKRSSSYLITLASVLLFSVYLFPVWEIDLEAPQFPEGLGLEIWAHTITGSHPHDLENINALNHYIGMKEISDEMFPELVLMPYIFAFLILLGLVTAYLKKRWMLVTWLGVFGLLTIAGLFDFYLWAYDYGHNLDPSAPIKVPGMSYQPPLIGSKVLLNMKATSLPGLAGWMAFGSFGLGVITWLREWKRKRSKSNGHSRGALVLLIAAVGFSVSSCGDAEPRAIDYGLENCAHCEMMIMDQKFAAQLINTHGKSYGFDAIECMLAFNENLKSSEKPVTMWVKNYAEVSDQWLNIENSQLLISDKIKSPMGIGLLAVSPKTDTNTIDARPISVKEATKHINNTW